MYVHFKLKGKSTDTEVADASDEENVWCAVSGRAEEEYLGTRSYRFLLLPPVFLENQTSLHMSKYVYSDQGHVHV